MHTSTRLVLEFLPKQSKPLSRQNIEVRVGLKTTAVNKYIKPLIEKFYLFEYLKTNSADIILSCTTVTFLGRGGGYFSYLLAKEEILKEYIPFSNILP